MSDRAIKLVVAYDGTEFAGWQRQKDARSVQGELERALAKMHGHEVQAIGAGRTDSGVHAAGQVASFHTDIAAIPAERFRLALNRLLPPDLRVMESSEEHIDFHARFDARLRRYRYFLSCSGECPPFRSRYAWRLHRRPDLAVLNRMAACLRGEHDFTTFSSAKDKSENRSRYVHSSSFRVHDDGLVFEVAANAFLWRMVRSLVGTMIEFEAKGLSGGHMKDALDSSDRSRAGSSAPSAGLFLWNVEYYPEPRQLGRYGDYLAKRNGREAQGSAGNGDSCATLLDTARVEGLPVKRLVPGYGIVEE